MAQENKMQRQFEEVLREAAQERQATRPLQLRQFVREETHAGELTDEDGDKTDREADVRARSAPQKKEPIPQHVQLGRYNSRHRRPCGATRTRQPKNLAAGDNRLVEWNEARETITPQATHTRVTMKDGGEKSYSENLDPTSGYSPPTIECDTHRDHGTHQDRGKPGRSYILTARDYQCDTDRRDN